MPGVRRFISVFTLLALAFFSVPAWAAPFQGGTITIDLPDTWTATYDAEMHQIFAESADKTCRVAIQVGDSNGVSDQQMAESLSRQLGGSPPQQVPGFDNYYFKTIVQNMEMTVSFFESGGKVLLYIEGGDTLKYEKDTIHIWNSMTSSDPAEKALFDSLAKA
jgi:hypothetical protein